MPDFTRAVRGKTAEATAFDTVYTLLNRSQTAMVGLLPDRALPQRTGS